MSLESLAFNITTRKFIISPTVGQAIPAPVWGHNDVRDFGCTFVQTAGPGRIQVLTGVTSAQVNVSDPATPNTVLATYTAGPVVNNEYPFLLTLGAALDTYMSGVTDRKQASGQFRLVTTTGENRYPFDLFISPKQATSTTPDTASLDGYWTQSQTNALFVPLEMAAGGTRILTSPSGRRFKESINDDGTVHYDEV